jgi:hypothetical protein
MFCIRARLSRADKANKINGLWPLRDAFVPLARAIKPFSQPFPEQNCAAEYVGTGNSGPVRLIYS